MVPQAVASAGNGMGGGGGSGASQFPLAAPSCDSGLHCKPRLRVGLALGTCSARALAGLRAPQRSGSRLRGCRLDLRSHNARARRRRQPAGACPSSPPASLSPANRRSLNRAGHCGRCASSAGQLASERRQRRQQRRPRRRQASRSRSCRPSCAGRWPTVRRRAVEATLECHWLLAGAGRACAAQAAQHLLPPAPLPALRLLQVCRAWAWPTARRLCMRGRAASAAWWPCSPLQVGGRPRRPQPPSIHRPRCRVMTMKPLLPSWPLRPGPAANQPAWLPSSPLPTGLPRQVAKR